MVGSLLNSNDWSSDSILTSSSNGVYLFSVEIIFVCILRVQIDCDSLVCWLGQLYIIDRFKVYYGCYDDLSDFKFVRILGVHSILLEILMHCSFTLKANCAWISSSYSIFSILSWTDFYSKLRRIKYKVLFWTAILNLRSAYDSDYFTSITFCLFCDKVISLLNYNS